VRRALSEGSEWTLPVASDVLPPPDVAVERGPVVVVERGLKPPSPMGGNRDGDERGGTCLPYILSTVKLDVPAERSNRRGVVVDGEHVILVKVRIYHYHYHLFAAAASPVCQTKDCKLKR
jgi:hypothetical protein